MAGATPSVGELFRARARIQKSLPAIEYQDRLISYGELLDRVDRLTGVLAARGLVRGDRIALLSRNRPEYLEVELAAANLGVITACLNWRLSERELAYCIELVSPKLLIAEQDLTANLGNRGAGGRELIVIGDEYEHLLRQQERSFAPRRARSGGRPRHSLHQWNHRPAERRRHLAPRHGRARAGIQFRTQHSSARRLRGMGAAVSHGIDRSQPGNLAARWNRHRRRRLSGRAAIVRAAALSHRLVRFDPRHDRCVHCRLPGAADHRQGRRLLRRDGRPCSSACAG